MKILDAIGNEVRRDDTVVWRIPAGAELKAHVVEVTRPGLITLGKNEKFPGKVILQVELGLVDPNNEKDITLAGFIKTYDPDGERIVEGMLKKKQSA